MICGQLEWKRWKQRPTPGLASAGEERTHPPWGGPCGMLSEILAQGMYAQEMPGQVLKTDAEGTELLTIAKNWYSHECPLIGNWIKKKMPVVHPHGVYAYAAIKHYIARELNASFKYFVYVCVCVHACIYIYINQGACTADPIYVNYAYMETGPNW